MTEGKETYVVTVAVESATDFEDTLNGMWRLEMTPEARDALIGDIREALDAWL